MKEYNKIIECVLDANLVYLLFAKNKKLLFVKRIATVDNKTKSVRLAVQNKKLK